MPIRNCGSARCVSNKLPDRQTDPPLMIARAYACARFRTRARKR
jgi:hypothetical protein